MDRKHFAVHVDMCNLINSFDKVYHTGEMTKAVFAAFGPYIRSVHAKDTVLLEKRLTLHIDEAIPGQGVFDYEVLLKECHNLGDIPVMAEHLETEAEYDQATGYLMAKAEELGIPFERPFIKQA